MNINKIKIGFISGAVIFLLAGCSSTIPTTITGTNIPYPSVDQLYYEVPRELKDDYLRVETITKYKNYLVGKTIFIDPGHGGEDRRNKSLTGAIVEADVNLKVALMLKDFLEEAGARVIMSRYGDDTVPLENRAYMANESDADVFISIHHNASANKQDYWTDYTTTYYHAAFGYYEYEPCARDLARYIQRDLSYSMRNSGGLISFDGTVSDYVIFSGEGFLVLRDTEIPAVLVECAFFTNRMEEKRLAIDEFNEVQAWGIFRGIGKYFASGIPNIVLLMNQSKLNGDVLDLTFKLEDNSGIQPESIVAYFDSVKTEHQYNEVENLLKINLTGIKKGAHEVRIICQNNNNNYSFPYHKKLILK